MHTAEERGSTTFYLDSSLFSKSIHFVTMWLKLIHRRLLPEITLNRTVKGEQAVRLQSCFSPGVIALEGPKQKAVVADARYDMCSRNVYRHEDIRDAVTIGKVKDHFIFTGK